MPVIPYAEPTIAPNIAQPQPWPQQAEERLSVLESIVGELSVMHGSFFPHNQHPELHDEKIIRLMGEVADLRQQIADLRASNSALIEAMLGTDIEALGETDGDDDADF